MFPLDTMFEMRHAVGMLARSFVLALLAGAPLAFALAEYPTLEEALRSGREQKRAVMLDLTGTDWCTACIHLRQTIIESPAFEEALGDKLALVSVEYPRTPALKEKITPEEWEKREDLLRSYGLEALPAVVLMDEEGLPFGLIQGTRRTPEDYIPLVQEALRVREARDAALEASKDMEGMERARALVGVLELLPEVCRDKYHAILDDIRTLDTENTLGYHHLAEQAARRMQQMKELRELTDSFAGRFRREDLHDSIAQLNAFLAQPELAPEIRQRALMAQADCYAFLRDYRRELELLKEALHATASPAGKREPSRTERKLQTDIEYLEKNVIPRL